VLFIRDKIGSITTALFNTEKMKKLFLAFLTFCSAQIHSQYIWTNGAATGLWNNLYNWSPNGVPGDGDNVVFNGSSSANCIVNINHLNIGDLTITSGYTGTISMPLISDFDISGNFTQAGGTINLSGISDFKLRGNFTQSGGTFLAPNGPAVGTGAAMTIVNSAGAANTLSLSGGIFNKNGGTLEINLASAGTVNVVGPFAFNSLCINQDNMGDLQRNVNFGTSAATSTLLIKSNSRVLAFQGNLAVTNSLSVAGSNSVLPAFNTATFTFNGSSANITSDAAAGQVYLGNITINTSGFVNLNGNLSLTGNWTSTQIGSLTAGSSTVNFYGAAANIIAGGSASTCAYFHNIKIAPASTLNISGSSLLCLSGNLSDDGMLKTNISLLKLIGSGAQTINGSSTLTTINALEINNSGIKTLAHPVTILDSVKIHLGTLASGGNLKLKSTAALKARIAQITGGGAITGNINVETFAPGGYTDWSVIGPSGVSGLTVANWEGQIPMTCSFCPNGPTAAGGVYFVSIRGWNEMAPAGNPLAYYEKTYLSPINAGEGCWVFLGNGLYNTTDLKWTVSGAAVTGPQILPLTNSSPLNGDGWNLISNPYASPISWTKLRNGNSFVDNAIYIYNADLGVTTCFVNGVSTPDSIPGTYANDVIPMGQGFYVHTTMPTVLMAQESNKVDYNTSANAVLRTAKNSRPLLRLKLNGFDASYDETVIGFEHSASTAFDAEYDAQKIFSSPGYRGYPGIWTKRTTISSKLYEVDYAINTIPPVNGAQLEIPILARVYASGNYTIRPAGLESLPEDVCVTLLDKVNGQEHDLRSASYSCNINDSTQSARFVLKICAVNSNPIGLAENTSVKSAVSIKGVENGAIVALHFAVPTKAIISVQNLLGQKIIADKEVLGLQEEIMLDLNASNEVLLVTVKTDHESITKKLIR
jgi:hypothetical protein